MKENSVRESMKKGIQRLLKKKSFLDITVTDLVKESGIARASFYRKYNSVDQVVDDIMTDIKKSFDTVIIPIITSNDEMAIKGVLFDFFTKVKNKEIPIIDILPENLPFLISKLEQCNLFSKKQQYNSIAEKYGLSLYIVMVVSIARMWGYYGYKETAEELVDYTYSRLFN